MRRALLLILSFLSIACATTHHGPMQRLTVTTEPAGAEVRVEHCGAFATPVASLATAAAPNGDASVRRLHPARDSQAQSRTPVVVQVSRRATQCTISVAMPGYKEVHVKLARHVAPQFARNSEAISALCSGALECYSLSDLAAAGIIGGVLTGAGMATDAVTGSMFELRPNRVDIFLCPVEEFCSGGMAGEFAEGASHGW